MDCNLHVCGICCEKYVKKQDPIQKIPFCDEKCQYRFYKIIYVNNYDDNNGTNKNNMNSFNLGELYDMKYRQNNIKDAIPNKKDDPCPLFKKYVKKKAYFLGSGSYGVVIRYPLTLEANDDALKSKKSIYQPPPPLYHALKFQLIKVTTDKTINYAAYTELFIMRQIMNTVIYIIPSDLYNHIDLYDWVKCYIKLYDDVFLKLNEEQRTQIIKARYGSMYRSPFKESKEGYLVMVTQYIDGGDLRSLIMNGKERLRIMDSSFFIPLIIQLFGFITTMAELMRFTHGDLNARNILLQKYPIHSTVTHLVYYLPSFRVFMHYIHTNIIDVLFINIRIF